MEKRLAGRAGHLKLFSMQPRNVAAGKLFFFWVQKKKKYTSRKCVCVCVAMGSLQWVIPGHDQSLSAIKSTEPTCRPLSVTLKAHFREEYFYLMFGNM